MKKNSWIYLGLGAVAIALFFAYKKRNVPATKEEIKDQTGSGDIKRRKELQSVESQFIGMGGNIYVKPKNLIPNVMDNNFYNATGSSTLKTTNICVACQTAAQNQPEPNMKFPY